MNSPLRVIENENEIVSSIPPVICNNPRERVDPEQVNLQNLKLFTTDSKDDVKVVAPNSSKLPVPLYPLSIEWSPSLMFFEINNAVIFQKVRIWNACSRSVYINCCGLWGDSARLGAKWRCFPRTRFLLSPGLTADLLVKATPKEQSLVSSAQLAIQLAAGHKRDIVVGYFVIPIMVKFLKYTKPCLGEVESADNNVPSYC